MIYIYTHTYIHTYIHVNEHTFTIYVFMHKQHTHTHTHGCTLEVITERIQQVLSIRLNQTERSDSEPPDAGQVSEP